MPKKIGEMIHIVFYVNGKRMQRTTGLKFNSRNWRKAAKMETEERSKALKDKPFLSIPSEKERANRLTVERVLSEYLEYLELRVRSGDEKKRVFDEKKRNSLKFEALFPVIIFELTKKNVLEHINTRQLEFNETNDNVNRQLSVLSLAIQHAQKWHGVIISNVTTGLRLKRNSPRTRHASIEEIELLLSAAKKSENVKLYDYVVILLNTGMRVTELLSLKESELCIEDRTATLKDTKNGSTRVVILNNKAVKSFKSLLAIKKAQSKGIYSPYIFPSDSEKGHVLCFKKSYNSALKTSGIIWKGEDKLTMRDLRTTYATHALNSGVPLNVVQGMLGHSSPELTARVYAFTKLSEDKNKNILLRFKI